MGSPDKETGGNNMPIEPSGDTIRARADYRRGKRMWRIADKSDRKAAREGKAADAAKLRGQIGRAHV